MIVGFSGGGTDIAVASRAVGWSVTFPLNPPAVRMRQGPCLQLSPPAVRRRVAPALLPNPVPVDIRSLCGRCPAGQLEAGRARVSGAWQGQRFPCVCVGPFKRRVTWPLASNGSAGGVGTASDPTQPNSAESRPHCLRSGTHNSSRTLREGEEVVRLNSVHCCLDVLVSAVCGDDDLDSDA